MDISLRTNNQVFPLLKVSYDVAILSAKIRAPEERVT